MFEKYANSFAFFSILLTGIIFALFNRFVVGGNFLELFVEFILFVVIAFSFEVIVARAKQKFFSKI